MSTQVTGSIWLNDVEVCRIEHLAEVSGLSIDEIEDLVENEIIVPTDNQVQPRTFQLQYVVTVKTARRLRDDFQLDRHGMALAMTLMRRISDLETELREAQAKLGQAAT